MGQFGKFLSSWNYEQFFLTQDQPIFLHASRESGNALLLIVRP
jgi:hypothetical protein